MNVSRVAPTLRCTHSYIQRSDSILYKLLPEVVKGLDFAIVDLYLVLHSRVQLQEGLSAQFVFAKVGGFGQRNLLLDPRLRLVRVSHKLRKQKVQKSERSHSLPRAIGVLRRSRVAHRVSLCSIGQVFFPLCGQLLQEFPAVAEGCDLLADGGGFRVIPTAQVFPNAYHVFGLGAPGLHLVIEGLKSPLVVISKEDHKLQTKVYQIESLKQLEVIL